MAFPTNEGAFANIETDVIYGGGGAAATLWTQQLNGAAGPAAIQIGDAAAAVTVPGQLIGTTFDGNIDRAGTLDIGAATATLVRVTPPLSVSSATNSTTTASGAIIVAGGIGLGGNVTAGGSVSSQGLYVGTIASGWAGNATVVGIDAGVVAGGADTAIGAVLLSSAVDNGASAQPFALVDLNGSTQASSNAAYIDTLVVREPQITIAGGVVTTATALRVPAAPTEGANNYAVLVESGLTHLDRLELAQPASGYFYNGPYTTVADASAPGIAIPIVWIEGADPSTHWTVNVAANGVIAYSGRPRLFTLVASTSISTASGGASTIALKIQQDQTTGTWADIPGAETDRYLSGTNDTGSASVVGVFQMVTGTDLRVLLESNNAGARYTFNHLSVVAAPLM